MKFVQNQNFPTEQIVLNSEYIIYNTVNGRKCGLLK